MIDTLIIPWHLTSQHNTMATFTSIYHRKPYPAIDPAAPQNSMHGRSVLIAGATGGIGLATAHAFLKASPSQIIILGRRESALTAAVAELNAARPTSSPAKIIGKQCDISDPAHVNKLWEGLKSEHIEVDILILNAANISVSSTHKRLQDMIPFFDMNVSAGLRMADGFLEQGPRNGKVIINVSTMAAHGSLGNTIGVVAYGASKAGGAAAFQAAADCTPATECFILNVHPGAVLTPSARENGWDENTVPWDDGKFCHVPCFCAL
jgi:NAD(P)-dependent dehydrogenase (short-subunit alcohol dehydrogenase family)